MLKTSVRICFFLMITSTWEKVMLSLGIQFQTMITAAFSQGRRGKNGDEESGV